MGIGAFIVESMDGRILVAARESNGCQRDQLGPGMSWTMTASMIAHSVQNTTTTTTASAMRPSYLGDVPVAVEPVPERALAFAVAPRSCKRRGNTQNVMC